VTIVFSYYFFKKFRKITENSKKKKEKKSKVKKSRVTVPLTEWTKLREKKVKELN